LLVWVHLLLYLNTGLIKDQELRDMLSDAVFQLDSLAFVLFKIVKEEGAPAAVAEASSNPLRESPSFGIVKNGSGGERGEDGSSFQVEGVGVGEKQRSGAVPSSVVCSSHYSVQIEFSPGSRRLLDPGDRERDATREDQEGTEEDAESPVNEVSSEKYITLAKLPLIEFQKWLEQAQGMKW